MIFKHRLLVVAVVAALAGCAAAPERPQSTQGATSSEQATGVATDVAVKTASPVVTNQAESASEPAVVLPLTEEAPPAKSSGETIQAEQAHVGMIAEPALVPAPEIKAVPAPAPIPVSTPAPAPVPVQALQVAAPPAAAPVVATAAEKVEAPVPVVVVPKAAPVAAAAIPPAPSKIVADRKPRTFALTVAKKDASHPYFNNGHDLGFVIDGVQGRELALTRGVEYTFSVDTGVQHDFYFTMTPVGRGAGTVAEGVHGQFTYQGDVTFTPTANTPETVFYQCRNHKYMGGRIRVANAGDEVTLGGAPSFVEGDKAERRAANPQQAKQKLSYAEMLMGGASTKRVMASSNGQAKGMVTEAKAQIDRSHAALDGGDQAAALAAADEALRLLNGAIRLVPDTASANEHRDRYTALQDQLKGFESSYQKNLTHGMKPKAGKELDQAKYSAAVKEAEDLDAKGQYEEAAKRLSVANDMVTAALGAMLDSQTVVYEKNFSTPKEEYEFEAARYDSYAELIPLAIEQRRPSEQTLALMDDLIKRAKEIQAEGAALAVKGDHKMAVMALQAATERLQQALRLAGVQ